MYLVVQLSNKWNWKTRKDSNKVFEFTCVDGISLINPFYCNNGFIPSIAFIIKDDVYMSSEFLLFKLNEDISTKGYFENNVDSFLSKFIHMVWYTTKQVSIDIADAINYTGKERESIRLERIPYLDTGKISNVNAEFLHFSLDWESLSKIDQLITDDFKIPIYGTILLDALKAIRHKDFRKAILYATIAIESMMSILLDRKHEELVKNKEVKLIEVRTNEGLKPVDPIYKSLNDKFQDLINARSLYVFGKSLLHEDKNLYDKALNLYKTRNSLVHSGDIIPNSDKLLEISEEGSIEAYNIAIGVFKWMDIDDFEEFIPYSLMQIK